MNPALPCDVRSFGTLPQVLNSPFVQLKEKHNRIASVYCDNFDSPFRPRHAAPQIGMNACQVLNGNQTRHHMRPNDRGNFQHALQRSVMNSRLMGDFSKDYCLPTIEGRNLDVATITPYTVSSLLRSEQSKKCMVFDCRYPYEYDGGHIKGARNTYTREMLLKELFCDGIPIRCGKLLIFYCEFSSKRGPAMYRFLRGRDRNLNPYPSLFYPEMYLIEGGYKEFFYHYKMLCDPPTYTEMKDKKFREELSFYRSHCKTETRTSKSRSVRHSLES